MDRLVDDDPPLAGGWSDLERAARLLTGEAAVFVGAHELDLEPIRARHAGPGASPDVAALLGEVERLRRATAAFGAITSARAEALADR